MEARNDSEPNAIKNPTTVERKSERELVVTRTVNGPARIVFEAWTKPELLKRWWVPKSFGLSLLSCEADARVGGKYRLVFSGLEGSEPMAFFGRYIEVTACSRLAWTNEEGGDAGQVTTVTFEERGGKTLLVLHELYPSKEALDAACDSGATAWGHGDGSVEAGTLETFEQLDDLVVALGRAGGTLEGSPQNQA
jgi:uncharacterized protein YndB with AHSA1/START domain